MITLIIAALMFGLATSLHCVGMCGPLMMIVHSGGSGRNFKWWINKVIYHLGRLSVYAVFGLIVGIVGKGFVAFGFQQWLAIISGVVLIIMLFVPVIANRLKSGGNLFFGKIKSKFSTLIQQKKPHTSFLLGVINGLLPCGPVYAAMSLAFATGSPAKSALFMVIFGIGTSPALFGVALFGNAIRSAIKPKNFNVVRIGLTMVALLFILRGANLGIPYLSPEVSGHGTEQKMDCCKPRHKH